MNVDELLGIAQGCLGSVADQVLGWETTRLESSNTDSVENGICALIPVESNRSSLELSFSVGKDHAEVLSRQMLMLEDDEPIPDDMELGDTLGEIANITAGELKKSPHRPRRTGCDAGNSSHRQWLDSLERKPTSTDSCG